MTQIQAGRFVVVEGLEGAGKTTAMSTVHQWVEAFGCTVVQTREPGVTPLAEEIRTLVKTVRSECVAPETELLLMYAARVQLLSQVIRPALSRGTWVLADRHDLSSRAYQGGGRKIASELIDGIRQAVLGTTIPDFTLYLDIDPVIGLQRVRVRGDLDRIELEQLEFFQRTRARYLEIALSEPNIAIIDASRDIPEVQEQIIKALQKALGDKLFNSELSHG